MEWVEQLEGRSHFSATLPHTTSAVNQQAIVVAKVAPKATPKFSTASLKGEWSGGWSIRLPGSGVDFKVTKTTAKSIYASCAMITGLPDPSAHWQYLGAGTANGTVSSSGAVSLKASSKNFSFTLTGNLNKTGTVFSGTLTMQWGTDKYSGRVTLKKA